MSAAPQLDRLAAARRALAEASSVAGVALTRSSVRARHAVIATGIAPLDEALGGGLPRGRIVEVIGPRSSGRLSLTLTLLSSALRTGEPVALIDAADALDPRALHPDDRPRVLWIRPPDALAAMKCADLLLDAGGFALVAMYLVGVGTAVRHDHTRARQHAMRERDPAHTTTEQVRVTGKQGIGSAAWARIAQRAERAKSGMVVALDAKSTHAPGAFAYASLGVSHHRAHWRGRKLLETVECRIDVTRSKLGGGVGASTEVRFSATG
jgi:hypothetical protein